MNIVNGNGCVLGRGMLFVSGWEGGVKCEERRGVNIKARPQAYPWIGGEGVVNDDLILLTSVAKHRYKTYFYMLYCI